MKFNLFILVIFISTVSGCNLESDTESRINDNKMEKASSAKSSSSEISLELKLEKLPNEEGFMHPQLTFKTPLDSTIERNPIGYDLSFYDNNNYINIGIAGNKVREKSHPNLKQILDVEKQVYAPSCNSEALTVNYETLETIEKDNLQIKKVRLTECEPDKYMYIAVANGGNSFYDYVYFYLDEDDMNAIEPIIYSLELAE